MDLCLERICKFYRYSNFNIMFSIFLVHTGSYIVLCCGLYTKPGDSCLLLSCKLLSLFKRRCPGQAQTGADIILAGVQADVTSLEYDTEAGRGEERMQRLGAVYALSLLVKSTKENVTDTIGETVRERDAGRENCNVECASYYLHISRGRSQ